MSANMNRAFMYGESVFTTMRMINGHLQDWNLHFDRLKDGVEFVYGPFTDGDDWGLKFRSRLKRRLDQEAGDKIVRLTIFRSQVRGLLRTGIFSIDDLDIEVQFSAYDPTRTEGKMVQLRTCAAVPKPHWWPSFLKAGNYLETILSQKVNMKPGDDDILFLSEDDTVLESSVANIFVVRHNKLYTAPVGPNVLAGIMRKKVIDCFEYYFDDFLESETSLDQLMKADAVFGTNSVRGPFLISRIDDREIHYSNEFQSKFEDLRKRVLG